ncbi:MAG: hypothetical protein ACYDCH_07085 [Gaiellaceae bacterium]
MRVLLATLAVAAAPAPARLLKEIAAAAWPASGLPAHVTIAQAGAVPVSAQGRRHHAAGEIAFVLKGPDPSDEILFEVFPTAADASGDIRHPHLNGGDRKRGAAAGIAHSLLITSSVAQSGKAVGVTIGAAVRGNVIVQAISTSRTRPKEGDTAEVVALLAAGIAHLGKLGGVSA